MKSIKVKGKIDTYLIFPEEKQFVFQDDAKFGKTFLGFRQTDGHPFIIKHFKSNTQKHNLFEIYFHQEALIKNINANISSSVELIHQKEHLFLVKEYIHGIDLKKLTKTLFFISKKQKTIFWLKTFVNILESFDEIHKQNIIHCDLKPANIVVEYQYGKINKNNPQVKIIDFGLSKTPHFNPDNGTKTPFNILYSAPEKLLYFHNLISPASDIYSIGIMLYECLTDKHPFTHKFPHMIIDQQLSMELPSTRYLSDSIFAIIKKSTHRELFPKPPHYYNYEQKHKMIQNGINKRYKTTIEMADDMRKVLDKMTNKHAPKTFYKQKNILNEYPILIFDGNCILCKKTVQWLIKYDKTQILRYTNFESKTVTNLSKKIKFPINKSVVLLLNDKTYTKSDAFLKTMSLLGGWKAIFLSLYIIPRFLRNFIYDIIAKNRHKWFGKSQTCYIPHLQDKHLFLN